MPGNNNPNPTNSGDAAPVPAAARQPISRPRDPPVFSGTGEQDFHDWLSSYERVSKHNAWDDTLKLNNVSFYLSDLAKTWFFNHESDLPSWTQFVSKATDIFGRPTIRKVEAQRKLSIRLQLPHETYASYIEDVVALCNRVDHDMTELDQVKHVLKGISEDAFHLLVLKSPSSIQEITNLCQSLQDARNARITLHSPFANGAPTQVAEVPSVDSLRHLIREIIQEELGQSALANATAQPISPASSLRSLVQQELAAIKQSEVQPPTAIFRPSYADVLRTVPASACPLPSFSTRGQETLAPLESAYHLRSAPVHEQVLTVPPPRPETRTCFYCGIRGHIARFCRRRRRETAMFYTRWEPGLNGDRYRAAGDGYRVLPQSDVNGQLPSNRPDEQGPYRTARRRSPSPYPRRPRQSPSRNRSVSPLVTGNT